MNGVAIDIDSDKIKVMFNTANSNSGFGYVNEGSANKFINNECSNNASGNSSPSELCSP